MSNDKNGGDGSKNIITLKGRKPTPTVGDDIIGDDEDGFVKSLKITLAVNGGFVLDVEYDLAGSDTYILESKEQLLSLLTDMLGKSE